MNLKLSLYIHIFKVWDWPHSSRCAGPRRTWSSLHTVSCSCFLLRMPAGWPTSRSTTQTSTLMNTTSTGEQRLRGGPSWEVRPGGRGSGSLRGFGPGSRALCRVAGFAGAGESLDGWATPLPGIHDRTPHWPGLAWRGSPRKGTRPGLPSV